MFCCGKYAIYCLCVLCPARVVLSEGQVSIIEKRRKREGQIMEQKMTKEGWTERMIKTVNRNS